MKQPKLLKAFLVSVSYANNKTDFILGKGKIKSIVIVARYEKEAVQKLLKHLTINLQLKEETFNIFSVQRLRKTRKNAYYFSIDFYEKQEYFLEHYEERNNKQ